MKASDQIKEWIKLEERRDGPALKPQTDPDGNIEVGWGHRLTAPYTADYTLDQVENFFENDIAIAERSVSKNITMPLSQWQFDALVSFVFNDGEEALTHTIAKKLNSGNIYEAMDTLLKYVHGKHGNVISGLVVRRVQEASIFLKLENQYEYH